MSDPQQDDGPWSHHNCTFIMPSRRVIPQPEGAPRWMWESTHNCWCSSWRMTLNGLRVWRGGRWERPKKSEVRRVKGAALVRYEMVKG